MNNSLLYYSVGALLYCPANRKNIADSIVKQRFGTKYSLALCLEDTIRDDSVAEAEHILIQTLRQLDQQSMQNDFYVPKIFVAGAKCAADWQTPQGIWRKRPPDYRLYPAQIFT